MTDEKLSFPSEAIDAAVAWWREQWIPDATRAAFADALRAVLNDAENLATGGDRFRDGRLLLKVDYDPQGIMLLAVRMVVPDCRGFMFSARGLLPCKVGMWLAPTYVEVRDGYLAEQKILWGTKGERQ